MRHFSLLFLLLIPSAGFCQDQYPAVKHNQVCTPGTYVETYALGVPENGLTRSDGAVPEGYRVTLRGVAREVDVSRNCATRFRPVPFRWSVMYSSPDGSARPLTTELTASSSLAPSFVAHKGTYEVKLETNPRQSGSSEGKKELELWAITCGDWLPIGPKVAMPSCFKAGVCRTGMVMAIAFDADNPDHMFVGTRGGGVWESGDGGGYWRPISDHRGLPAGLVVGRLAVAPRKNGQQFGRIFAGTGSPDSIFLGSPSAHGIYSSDDGGAKWKLLGNNVSCSRPGTYPQGTVSKIIVDPTNPTRIFASSNNGVFFSEDSGNCWSDLTANLRDFTAAPVRDLLLSSFSETPILYASVEPNQPTICNAVLTLSPGESGARWQPTGGVFLGGCPAIPQPSGHILLAKGPGTNFEEEMLYALVPHDNNGLQIFHANFLRGWVRGRDPSLNGCPVNMAGKGCQAPDGCNGCSKGQCFDYDLAIAVNPSNGCDVIVATTLGQMRSVDCGNNWQSFGNSTVVAVDPHTLAYHPKRPLLFMGHDQGLVAIDVALQPSPVDGCGAPQAAVSDCSKQKFSCWETRSNGMATDQFYQELNSSTFSNWKEGVIGALQDNGTKLRLDGTTNWKLINGGDGGGTSIDTKQQNVAYYGNLGVDSIIARTNDAKSPNANTQKTDAAVGRAARLWSDPYSPGILLRSDRAGKLYYAPDAGTVLGEPQQPPSWTCIDPTPKDTNAVVTGVDFPGGSGVYYVATTQVTSSDSFRLGGIYKVVVNHRNPPVTSCENPLGADEVAITTILSPEQHFGSAQISVDPENPQTGLYVTLQNFGPHRVCHILQDPNSGKWIITPIAGESFPGFGTTGNFWQAARDPSYPIAADPQTKGTLYVGTENGLAVGIRNGTDDSKWTWRMHPYFPTTEVSALQVSRGEALIYGIVRASTIGRSVWELPSCPIPLVLRIPALVPNVHVPVPPPINPFLPLANLVLPVEYALPASAAAVATLRTIVTQNGRPSPFFITETVPIQAGQGTTFVGIMYGRKNPPLGSKSDGITLQMLGREGTLLAEEKIPFNALWRRLDARSLFVGADVEKPDGDVEPVRVALSVSWGRIYRRIATASSLAVPKQANIVVEAPQRIETPAGIAHFRRWVGIIDEPEGTSRVNRSVFGGDPNKRRIKVRAAVNLALRAIYQFAPGYRVAKPR